MVYNHKNPTDQKTHPRAPLIHIVYGLYILAISLAVAVGRGDSLLAHTGYFRLNRPAGLLEEEGA
jgi:hypothetical protein